MKKLLLPLAIGMVFLLACSARKQAVTETVITETVITETVITPNEQAPDISSPVNLMSTTVPFTIENLPVRVATDGAGTYHRPFCPYAHRAWDLYGSAKRINFYSFEDLSEANTLVPDTYCMAGVYPFECPNNPDLFVYSINDEFCGGSIRRAHSIPDLTGLTLCKINGYIAVTVADPGSCENGIIFAVDTIQVGLHYLNTIPGGIGDANRDGNCDESDLDYFVRCYSGRDFPASPACVNTFDFDEDGDVDLDDLNDFMAQLNTGNSYWAQQNFPDAVVNETPVIPLRVGTLGSSLYHLPNCPAVQHSWETYGIHKRVDFYTWEQIDASGRTPDTRDAPYGCNAIRVSAKKEVRQ